MKHVTLHYRNKQLGPCGKPGIVTLGFCISEWFDNDADVFEFAEWDFHPGGHQVRLSALMESCTFLYTKNIKEEFVGLNQYAATSAVYLRLLVLLLLRFFRCHFRVYLLCEQWCRRVFF